jgi:UDP-N-acetylglucosamine diphosphorylase / glucose-1-phosphate thymidylyltransferase / UDP-N-acetylgalactosamine diphosphorylase / glucosamine-1-phosphate N-acetyltransferase / galactosamine-1-phosphate N-acetyltransferase
MPNNTNPNHTRKQENNMRTLHIILPMAGYGSRFAKVGVTTPKPLIPVDGKPMFMKAIASFDGIDCPKRYTVIIRKEHNDEYNLEAQLKEVLPEVNVVITDEPATGALRDAFRAQPYLQPDEGILIMDCDIEIGGEDYFTMIKSSLSGESDIAGGLLLFEADSPRYSYAELDENGTVIRTAEKVVISPYAIGGGYYIASTETFVKGAEAEFEKPLGEGRPEYYISYLFNTLIEQGGKVKGALGHFVSFGTPEELAAYEESHRS